MLTVSGFSMLKSRLICVILPGFLPPLAIARNPIKMLHFASKSTIILSNCEFKISAPFGFVQIQCAVEIIIQFAERLMSHYMFIPTVPFTLLYLLILAPNQIGLVTVKGKKGYRIGIFLFSDNHYLSIGV